MFPPVAAPPAPLGHCPFCNCWVDVGLRFCIHCKEKYSEAQVEAIRQEYRARKRETRLAMYFLLGLVVIVGSYVIYDLGLYKDWLAWLL